jgi:flagellum-specific peptidoglycan hydrolase FlgJ
MVKALWYLLYLAFWVVLCCTFFQFKKPKPGVTKVSIRDLEVDYLVNSLVLYFCVLLLTRFSNLLIVGVYFLSGQVDVLLRVTFGEAAPYRIPSRYLAERLWAGLCFSVRHPTLILTNSFVALGLVVGYPVVAGIVYFSSPIPSLAATLSIIRVTLLIVFIGGALVSLPEQIGTALSENLSDSSRRRFFASSLAGIAPQGIVLSTFLWTFSSGFSTTAHSTIVFRFTHSSTVLAILAAYFAIILLLPYLIGVARGTQQRSMLESRKKDALVKTTHVLRIPLADSYVPKLSQLVADLNKQGESFKQDDKSIATGLLLDERYKEEIRLSTEGSSSSSTSVNETVAGDPSRKASGPVDLSPQVQPTRKDTLKHSVITNRINSFDSRCYRLARPEDPRFQYLDWSQSYVEQLKVTASDLQTKRGGATRVTAAHAWADSYEGDRQVLSEMASQSKTNTFGAVVASTAITTAVSVFFTGFGNWLWTHAAQSLPK